MKSKLSLIVLLILILSLSNCAKRKTIRIPQPEKFEFPSLLRKPSGIRVRVGLGEFKALEIQAIDSFLIYDKNGKLIFSGSRGTFYVGRKTKRKATFRYYAFMGEFEKYTEALREGEPFEENGYRTRIVERGKVFKFGNRVINTVSYFLLVGPYSSKSELIKWGPSSRKGTYKEVLTPPGGYLIVKTSEGTFKVKDVLRITSRKPLVIRNFKELNHYTGNIRKRNILLAPVVELRISNNGEILLINEIDIELYVEGVLKGEMPLSFPEEALKAQAVAARTHALASLGKKLSLVSEPYDLTGDIFSQAFTGYNSDSRVKKIVEETKGIIILYKNKIAKVYFHSMCGGITASASEIWGEDIPYLKSILDYDLEEKTISLRSETAVRKFINSNIEVNCNVRNSNLRALKYYAKYFRWERRISARELRSCIKKQTGKDPGVIEEVKVVRRGTSGRALTVLVKGTKNSIFIEGDFQIRKALYRDPLPSTLFYINRIGNTFIIRGAGFGHGVGMCQIGAASLALKGKNFRKILEHYFPGATIEKVY